MHIVANKAAGFDGDEKGQEARNNKRPLMRSHLGERKTQTRGVRGPARHVRVFPLLALHTICPLFVMRLEVHGCIQTRILRLRPRVCKIPSAASLVFVFSFVCLQICAQYSCGYVRKKENYPGSGNLVLAAGLGREQADIWSTTAQI